MERELHEVEPREQSGRDSFGRYRAQVRSAAMAALSILEGKLVDRVYCDLHDDFVIRRVVAGKARYSFFQVKTKGKKNHQWTLNEIFGIKKRIKDQSKQSTNEIRDSFAGKLLSHTVAFGDSCDAVVFQTNVHIDDDVESALSAIQSGEFDDENAILLVQRFKPCFDKDDARGFSCIDIISKLQKLHFEVDVQYIKDGGDFEPIAREAIYKYSEIDLEHMEANALLLKLLSLVERKSEGVIQNFTQVSIEELAGISIADLLPILSISAEAYDSLIKGGDQKAIKSASIIQRSLSKAGAGNEQIEYCSRCKTRWDLWYRNNRLVLSELDMNVITAGIRGVVSGAWRSNGIELAELRQKILDLVASLKSQHLLYDLDQDLVLGGVFGEIVRMKS